MHAQISSRVMWWRGSHIRDLRHTEEGASRKLWGGHREREVEAACPIRTGCVKGVWS